MSETLRIAVVGATSLVGEAVLELLVERALPIGRVFALDVAEKDGETVSLGNLELDVASVEDFDFANASLAIFVGGSELSRRFVPEARNAGCAVIDFSAVYRLSEDVPLVVPGINDAALDDLGAAEERRERQFVGLFLEPDQPASVAIDAQADAVRTAERHLRRPQQPARTALVYVVN